MLRRLGGLPVAKFSHRIATNQNTVQSLEFAARLSTINFCVTDLNCTNWRIGLENAAMLSRWTMQ
jgi:hypothetical protein